MGIYLELWESLDIRTYQNHDQPPQDAKEKAERVQLEIDRQEAATAVKSYRRLFAWLCERLVVTDGGLDYSLKQNVEGRLLLLTAVCHFRYLRQTRIHWHGDPDSDDEGGESDEEEKSIVAEEEDSEDEEEDNGDDDDDEDDGEGEEEEEDHPLIGIVDPKLFASRVRRIFEERGSLSYFDKSIRVSKGKNLAPDDELNFMRWRDGAFTIRVA